MALLLDTHALLWWLAGDRKLSKKAKTRISDASQTVFVSAASVWEITTKFRIGRLPGAALLVDSLPSIIVDQSFSPLPISLVHADRAGRLHGEHRDPFDRMLIAQSLVEGLTLVSNEELFDGYGVARLW